MSRGLRDCAAVLCGSAAASGACTVVGWARVSSAVVCVVRLALCVRCALCASACGLCAVSAHPVRRARAAVQSGGGQCAVSQHSHRHSAQAQDRRDGTVRTLGRSGLGLALSALRTRRARTVRSAAPSAAHRMRAQRTQRGSAAHSTAHAPKTKGRGREGRFRRCRSASRDLAPTAGTIALRDLHS